MKKNIVESFSIEEAFRSLNKKNIKTVVEAINPEYKYIMYITYSTEDGQSDDQEQVNIIQSDGHYRVEGVSSVFGSLGDLIMDQISDAFDRAVEADAENPVDDEYNFADEWDIDFNISQNAYTKLTAADLVKIEGLLNRFSDIETVRKASLIADDIVDEDEAALNKPERNESKSRRVGKRVVENASGNYTAIILKDTILAIDDVDSDGNHYDTVKDEFIPVTIKANSDREAVEKIAEYVPIVLDDYDYSEDELIDEINNAVFPIAFEDWNAYYYDIGDSNMALISFKRPDGTELATESEIQATDVNDAVKKYNEFYLPESSIHDWGLKFDSITVGKPILL